MFDDFFSSLRVHSTKTNGRRRGRKSKPQSTPLVLECMEDRALLTIVYTPVFGVETTNQDDDEHMPQPQVYITFWGSYWSGAGASQVALVTDAASKVVTSTYPLITNQYGADGTNMTIAGTAFDNSDPSNGNFDDGNIDDVVQNQIDNGPFPESDAFNGNDHTKIYVVVTPPQIKSDAPTAAGFNVVHSDTDVSIFPPDIDFDDIGEVWAWGGTRADGTVNLDQFSLVFSHEIAEIMTDFDNEGYKVNPPAGAPAGSGNQIGDYEGNGYSFRMSNGVDVQPVWSRADNAWAVTDGTSQDFFLDGTGNWTGNTGFNGQYALTIQGDQLGADDNITVGKGANGGVQVTENGETVNFDPNQITSITIKAGAGSNTINFNPLPGGVTLSMNSVGGTIKLVAPNRPNDWEITGADSGTLDGQAFSNVSSLTGGSSSDTFNFHSGGSISGNIDGAGGSDFIDYSSLNGPVNANLTSNTATAIGGTFSNITSFVGSSSSHDTIVGPDANWFIFGFNSGSVNGTTFSSFENLTGSGLDDNFAFVGGSISGNIDGGGGNNTLDYSSQSFLPISVNLQTQTASHISGTFSNINHFVGSNSSGFDELTGPNAASVWNVTGLSSGSVGGVTFDGFETLKGGAGADQFLFKPGGFVDGFLDGGGGVNTLDYSALAGPVTVNFTTNTATNIGQTFANISNAIGSASPNDTIVGPDAAWVINGANAGTVNAISFSSFENLTGSSAADTFTFLVGGSISGNVDGGGGGDTIDYSNLAGPITVNLQTHTAPDIGGTFSNISGLVGSAGSDTLIGPDGGATWNLTGPNAGDAGGLGFSSFENLTGGSGDDQFVFLPGGGVSGNVDGGGGNNTLDYHNISTPITIGLGTNTATGIGGTFTGISGFVGGSGINNIVGPNTDTTWTITGVNTIHVLGFNFSNFHSIAGGSANDTFAFLTGGQLDGSIDGGGGVNNATYAGYTGDVIVDLLVHSATGAGGGIFNVRNVTGGNGNNLLVGDANANILVGGTGRNIIIGGAGADSVTGGGKDNILIGDSTVWDENLVALKAIFAEWTRTDLSFEQRLAHLISNGQNDNRLNGSFTLDKKTVLPDNAVDKLFDGAASALDWVFETNKQDSFTSHQPKDHITGL